MKKLILTCTMIATVSVLSFGQNAASTTAPGNAQPTNARPQAIAPEKIAEMRATRFKQQLSLTDDQYKKVYDVELSFIQQNQKLAATGAPTPGASQQLMMSHDQQMKQILNAEQSAKYEQMSPMRRPMPAAGGAAPTSAPANH